MATLEELYGLRNMASLRNKVAAAIAIEVDDLAGGTTDANTKWWMKQAISDPGRMAKQMMWAVLAASAGSTVSQITSATDPAIQLAVKNAVPLFATIAEPV